MFLYSLELVPAVFSEHTRAATEMEVECKGAKRRPRATGGPPAIMVSARRTREPDGRHPPDYSHCRANLCPSSLLTISLTRMPVPIAFARWRGLCATRMHAKRFEKHRRPKQFSGPGGELDSTTRVSFLPRHSHREHFCHMAAPCHHSRPTAPASPGPLATTPIVLRPEFS